MRGTRACSPFIVHTTQHFRVIPLDSLMLSRRGNNIQGDSHHPIPPPTDDSNNTRLVRENTPGCVQSKLRTNRRSTTKANARRPNRQASKDSCVCINRHVSVNLLAECTRFWALRAPASLEPASVSKAMNDECFILKLAVVRQSTREAGLQRRLVPEFRGKEEEIWLSPRSHFVDST